ncbi:two-component system sensor histidine kinase YesM [Paenibacillus aceris]|uniref:histidine kinase n=2 Tax=Paenibacillus aceris TaxID=869555 RepID=A0ABS4I2I5_9BACL|nr:histidine kinase [Paenibacillus aceris]MBP1964955.1 two-component system sensor histidine kinase YesM [Paenibacillus aceris]
MSIQKKFFIYLFLLVILPLLLASSIILSKASEIIGSKSREAVFQSFKQTQFRLNQIVSNAENLSLKVLGNEDVQQLSTLNEQSSQYEFVMHTNGINFFLQQELKMQPYIKFFLLVKGQNLIYHFGTYKENVNAELLQKAVDNNGIPLWAHNKDDVFLVRAINDINKFKLLSIEVLNVDERALEQAYTENDVWATSQTKIIDESGQIVSSINKSEIGTNINNQSYVRSAMRGSEGYFQMMVDEKKMSVFFYTMNNGWHVLKIIADSQINEPQKFLKILIMVAILICLLFGVVFSVIQNNGIIRPIKLLKREMDKVKRGNLEIQIQNQKKDEIGQLGFQFKEMALDLKDLIEKVYTSELKEKEAKLQLLSMQINPHFLYNTLDSIRWVAIKSQVDTVADQLEVLSNMFRYSLKQEHYFTTVQQEVEHVNNYMRIMNFRFNYIYEFIVDVDENTLQLECPHFILQPLIENSIQHGFIDMVLEGCIQISIKQEDSLIRICVEDNGAGTDEKRIRRMLDSDETESGYALRNIHNRIQLKYGTGFGVQFYSQIGKGSKVDIMIPVVKRISSM